VHYDSPGRQKEGNMYEVYYKCFYRDQWYWDSSHDTPEAAVQRAHGLNQVAGRGVVVTINGSTVWSAPQSRALAGVPVPVRAAILPYLD
jgi:hypothetical protein